jgi:uncharacterized protein
MDICASHGCAECCYDTEMPLTEEDAARLAALGHARDAFSRVGEDGVLYLQTVEPARADGKKPCFFLKEDRCSVYADRPAGCRVYPFILTLEGRVVRDDDCPWRREFKMETGVQRKLFRIATVVNTEAAKRQ